MMTGNELVEMVREHLHEADPDFWNAPRILVNLNKAMQRLVLKIIPQVDRIFYTSCTLTTVSGTRAYKLPDGTLYSGAAKCIGKIDRIQYGNEKPLKRGDIRLFYDTATGKPSRIAVAGNHLYFAPIPNAAYAYTLWYYYFPTEITASDTEIDFIEGFEPMIALEACRTSMIKDEADLSDIRYELAEYWKDFKETFCGNRITGEPEQMGESVHETSDLD